METIQQNSGNLPKLLMRWMGKMGMEFRRKEGVVRDAVSVAERRSRYQHDERGRNLMMRLEEPSKAGMNSFTHNR